MTKDTIANLTPEEFGAKYEAFKALVEAELKTVQALAEDETFNSKTDIDFWNRERFHSDNIYDRDVDDVIDIINAFKVDCEKYENKRGFYISNEEELSGEYEDSYAEIGYIGYKASWLEPKTKIPETFVNNEFRKFSESWLVPEGLTGYGIKSIDCKLLTLFKEGKIDWNTLRTLVYSDCVV